MLQRFKLYAAEDTLGYGGFFPGVEYCQMFIDKILRSKAWKEHSDVRWVKANYPIKGMSGAVRLDNEHGQIDYGLAKLCEHGSIHEMTHFLNGVPVTKGTSEADHEKDHGPKFAGALLWMYKRFIGAKTAETLRKEFDRVGVRYDEYN